MRQRLFIGLIAAAALAGCAPPIPVETRAAEELDIREAVFRHQFAHNASGQKQNARVLCLGVRQMHPVDGPSESDPEPALLARFSNHLAPVRGQSACMVDGSGVVDKATGAQGLSFRVGPIAWVNGEEVTLGGGYYEASLSSSGNEYRVRKIEGRWTVVEDRMTYIS